MVLTVLLLWFVSIIRSLNFTKNDTLRVREFRKFVEMVRKITETL
jgi:hypothetical protein